MGIGAATDRDVCGHLFCFKTAACGNEEDQMIDAIQGASCIPVGASGNSALFCRIYLADDQYFEVQYHAEPSATISYWDKWSVVLKYEDFRYAIA